MSAEPNAIDLTAKMKQLEFLGHEVLLSKKRVLELSRDKQWYREAWRATQKAAPAGQKKTWVFVSPKMFVKKSTTEAETQFKTAMETTEKELEETRKELRKNVDELRRFEGKQALTELGFDLKPVESRFFVDSAMQE